MQVEQAIFTSARSRSTSGYQLTARSGGVHDEWTRTLVKWGPSQGALMHQGPTAESLNCFPVDDQHFAVSRTIFGGPEYSRRGELQVFTRFLIVKNPLAAGYNHNPWLLLRVCCILGHLRFLSGVETELPALELPNQSLLGRQSLQGRSCQTAANDDSISNLVQVLQLGHPAALVGKAVSEQSVGQITARLSPEVRSRLSFTTGLRPSAARPFQLHLLPNTNQLNDRLNTMGITQVNLN